MQLKLRRARRLLQLVDLVLELVAQLVRLLEARGVGLHLGVPLLRLLQQPRHARRRVELVGHAPEDPGDAVLDHHAALEGREVVQRHLLLLRLLHRALLLPASAAPPSAPALCFSRATSFSANHPQWAGLGCASHLPAAASFIHRKSALARERSSALARPRSSSATALKAAKATSHSAF